MREKRKQIAFLFGDDDHWGPLTLYEQVNEYSILPFPIHQQNH